MLRRILLASAGAMALTGTALAEQPLTPAPNVTSTTFIFPPYNWTGPYIGLQIGGAGGRDSADVFVPGTDLVFPYGDSPQGVIGGFHVGWNYQINQIVVGLEGTVDGSSFGKTFHPFPDKSIIYSTSADIQGSIRGRVGYAWPSCPFLSYVTGGVAFAGIRNTYDSTAIGLDFISVSNTRVGWTVGGGVDYALTNNWSVGAEYRYTDFHFTDSSSQTIFEARHKLTQNSGQVRLTYKFDTLGTSIYMSPPSQ